MNEKNKEKFYNDVIRIMPLRIREVISQYLYRETDLIQEIVFRSLRPVCIYKKGRMYYLTENGCLTESADMQKLLVCTERDITDTFNSACCFSVYSHINEIKEGFLTINGGHRVGICGTAVVSDGQIINLRDVSTVSVRVAREVRGSGEDITQKLINSSRGLLICGSPCSGKTTVLRDIARLLSAKYAYRVTLVDSRGELAAVNKGINQMDIGLCDVLNGYPRAQGIEQAVRVMSPDYVICDEIGSEADVCAITAGVNSGAVFIATMHAGSKEELLQRINSKVLLNSGAFGKIMFLSGKDTPGQVKRIYDCEELRSV